MLFRTFAGYNKVGPMKMKSSVRILLIALLLISVSIQAADDGFVIKSGFLTGTQYRSLNGIDRQKYAMGLIDGILLSPFFGADNKRLAWLELCATGMNGEQIVAILDKYLRENPARWHESMNTLTYFSMKQECGR